jgi:hypothetical protein
VGANAFQYETVEPGLWSLLSHVTRKAPSDADGSSLSGATKPARGKGIRHHRQRAGLNFVAHRRSETGRTDLPEVLQVFVFTFSDNANRYVCNLLWSAVKFNISVRVVGFKPPGNAGDRANTAEAGFLTESSSFQDLQRLIALEKELRALAADCPEALIMWLDADVLFQRPLETAVQAFLTMDGRPALVWSAEKTCWPDGPLCALYYTQQPHLSSSSLNCGAAIGQLNGYLRFFMELRSHMLLPGQVNAVGLNVADITVTTDAGGVTVVRPRNDQEVVAALFADSGTNSRVGMELDRKAQIFFSVGGGGLADLVYNPHRGPDDLVIYRNARTGGVPAILHFNGLSKRDGEYYNAEMRLEPRAFQEAVLQRSQTVLQAPRSLCAGCSRFWLPFTDPAAAYPIGYFKRIVNFWRDDPNFVAMFGTPCEQVNASCSPEIAQFYRDRQLS